MSFVFENWKNMEKNTEKFTEKNTEIFFWFFSVNFFVFFFCIFFQNPKTRLLQPTTAVCFNIWVTCRSNIKKNRLIELLIWIWKKIQKKIWKNLQKKIQKKFSVFFSVNFSVFFSVFFFKIEIKRSHNQFFLIFEQEQ